MKKVIILTGVSGVGKTYARTTDPELRDLPYVDIADVYREFPEFHWDQAIRACLKRVRKALERHETIVIEGYFLPGTRTRQWLLGDLKVAGVHNVEVRNMWAPFEVCQGRIAAQFEREEISAAECRLRLGMLRECWRPKDPLTRDDVTWEELERGYSEHEPDQSGT